MKKWLNTLTASALTLCMLTSTQTIAFAEEEIVTANPERTTVWEDEPYETDLTKKKMLSTSSTASPIIADVSKWQGNIDWAKASKVLDFVVIRTQDGTATEDYMHKTYEAGAKANKLPFGVYAFNRAKSINDAKLEAQAFYKRADKSAQMYVVDVETISSKNDSMRNVINAYVAQLRKMTNKKVGLYVANHLYTSLNLDTSKFDFVWIPRYGSIAPKYTYDLWQYTDRGRVNGISGYVDLNRLAPGKTLTDISGQVKRSTINPVSKKKYYTTNPKKVVLKKSLYAYASTTFSDSKKVKKYAKNTQLTVKEIRTTPSGIPRLYLTNGTYISALRADVVKPISTISSYVADVPKAVMLKKETTSYKDVLFQKKAVAYKQNTVLSTKDIDYTDSGTPRIKIAGSTYVTANKAYIQPVRSDVKNYHYVNPKKVYFKENVNIYTSTTFKMKKGKITKGTLANVQSIAWTKAGTPVLKLSNDKYVTANKQSSLVTRNDIANYYYVNPKKIKVAKQLNVYKSTKLVKTGSTYKPGKTITVQELVWTSNGLPLLKIGKNKYITAKKNYVVKQ